MEVEISFEVTAGDIEQIEGFMQAEYSAAGAQGFYGAWKSIVPQLKTDNCILARLGGEAVAFLTYSIGEVIADLNYLVVAQVYWDKGVGKKLVAAVEDFARAKGLLVVQLLATDELNRKKWKSMGFLDAIKGFTQGGPKLYKALVEVAEPIEIKSLEQCSGKYIVLWAETNHLDSKDRLLMWTLDDVKNRKMDYPIIYPCLADWKVKYWRSELPVKAKNFKFAVKLDSDFLIVCEFPS